MTQSGHGTLVQLDHEPALVDIRDTVAALKKAGRTLDKLLQQSRRPFPTQSGAGF
jgi:hypothetical protein